VPHTIAARPQLARARPFFAPSMAEGADDRIRKLRGARPFAEHLVQDLRGHHQRHVSVGWRFRCRCSNSLGNT
jgi:hypothetical protein